MPQIILIAHNLRSCHNVGSLLRTADGLGIECVYLTGYTPYPAGSVSDPRLPYLAAKISRQITKTALGAEKTMLWQYVSDIFSLLPKLQARGYQIVALEQAPKSSDLNTYKPPQKLALIVGREVEGIEDEVLNKVDDIVEIPMQGHKESFNVAVAAAMALYHCRFYKI